MFSIPFVFTLRGCFWKINMFDSIFWHQNLCFETNKKYLRKTSKFDSNKWDLFYKLAQSIIFLVHNTTWEDAQYFSAIK